MISKYPGICTYCGKPTKAGIDQYSLEFKKGYHLECEIDEENQKPTPEQYALADRLGFRHLSWEQLLLLLGEAADRYERDHPDSRGRDAGEEVSASDKVD